MVCYSGYLYTQHSISGEKRVFRCEDRNCKSRCHMNIQMEVFVKEPSEHSHAPDPDRVHIIQLKNEIKTRGSSSEEATSTILFDALRTIPLNAVPDLPSNKSLMQTIRRKRQPVQLDENGQLPFVFRLTDRGENFVLFEDPSMLIFTCDKNLSILKKCKHWFMDGTFSICPNSHYQLFTVHGMFSLQIIPLVYVLLIGKATEDYNDFFEQLLLLHDFEPESILVDYEIATLKSIRKNFPDAQPIGCLFHMSQCLWRELRTLGYQKKYTTNDKFRMNVKKLLALAFVPVSDVVKGYALIVDDFDDEDNPLLDYFERVWVGKKKGRGIQRYQPKFSLQLWNMYERVIQDLPRSNNSIEGWHHAFNSRVSIKHPSIVKLTKCILREQSRFEVDIERLRAGAPPEKRKKVYAELDARLKTVTLSYNIADIEDYLNRIAMNLKIGV
ncbi:unnamed protein product [Adineta steineri]|uniref:MULE transposase domain-containing protein n=1 Tax=Adineta steineri TaxID=433720 RepID=A0A815CGK2_9BILA|nr:unnamed protein product [Adineta steineri]CAF1283458.1 unnamed protein product [Adineta steineri]